MSCQIRPTAVISDVPTVRRSLFPTDDLRGIIFVRKNKIKCY